jgi:hypothetical protein
MYMRAVVHVAWQRDRRRWTMAAAALRWYHRRKRENGTDGGSDGGKKSGRSFARRNLYRHTWKHL